MSQDIDFSQYKRKSPHQQSRDPLFEYNPNQQQEIDFSQYKRKPERSLAQKGGRLAMQVGLTGAERAVLGYELAVAPLASKEAQTVPYRQGVFEDIERLQDQKATGVWDKQDEELLENLKDQIKNPEKAQQFVKTADIGVRGLVKKATGIDTHPEGALEKAVSWTLFIKKGGAAKELIKAGTNPKQIIKAIMPTGTEVARGLGAGTALQMAEEEKFGPIGTLAAAVVGDIIGGKGAGLAKGLGKAIASPRQAAAKFTANMSQKFSSAEKQALQKEIIKDFRDAGLQADLGTITNNPLIQSLQARLAASGLTGEAFDKFKQTLTKEIQDQYKKVTNTLGESKFETTYEANELGKETLKKIRDKDLGNIRELYKESNAAAKGQYATLATPELAKKINDLEAQLKPGEVKSTQTQSVLTQLEKLKKDLYDAEGNLKPASVEALVNNKVNLGEIAQYEVQAGGPKRLLAGVVHDIDEALKKFGKDQNPEFLKNYTNSNKRMSDHFKTFRNDTLNKILTSEDPSHLLKKMDTAHGIKEVRKAFSKTADGKKIFKELSRFKMDEMIQKNMVDGASNQIKLGTFSNILDKGKNREIIHELLDPEAYKSLVKLQKNTGRLYDSAQKFYNASKSGTVVLDAGVFNKIVNAPLALAGAISGNYWLALPYLQMAGIKGISKLMTDPKFLRMTEDIILASQKNDKKMFQRIADKLKDYLKDVGPALSEQYTDQLTE